MSHQLQRQNRINKILATIRLASSKDIPIDEKKLIGQCCLEFGASRRTILEYLATIELAGHILRFKGVITAPKIIKQEINQEAEKEADEIFQTETILKDVEKNTK